MESTPMFTVNLGSNAVGVGKHLNDIEIFMIMFCHRICQYTITLLNNLKLDSEVIDDRPYVDTVIRRNNKSVVVACLPLSLS